MQVYSFIHSSGNMFIKQTDENFKIYNNKSIAFSFLIKKICFCLLKLYLRIKLFNHLHGINYKNERKTSCIVVNISIQSS